MKWIETERWGWRVVASLVYAAVFFIVLSALDERFQPEWSDGE